MGRVSHQFCNTGKSTICLEMSFCAVHLPRVIEKDLIKSGVSTGACCRAFPQARLRGHKCETLRYSQLQGKTLVISETK